MPSLAQLAWRSGGKPNGGTADQFGATAVDRDYAATLIAVPVRNCDLRPLQTSPLTLRLSCLLFYRKPPSLAPVLSLPSPFVRLRLFFFLHRCGFCKYWRNMAAVSAHMLTCWGVINWCMCWPINEEEEGKLWPLDSHLHHHHQPKQAATTVISSETHHWYPAAAMLPENVPQWGMTSSSVVSAQVITNEWHNVIDTMLQQARHFNTTRHYIKRCNEKSTNRLVVPNIFEWEPLFLSIYKPTDSH